MALLFSVYHCTSNLCPSIQSFNKMFVQYYWTFDARCFDSCYVSCARLAVTLQQLWEKSSFSLLKLSSPHNLYWLVMLNQIFLPNNKHSCIVLLAIWAYHKQCGEFNHTWYLLPVDPVHSSRCWLKCGNSSAVLKWKDPKLVFFLDAFLWSWDSSFYQDTHNFSFDPLKSYSGGSKGGAWGPNPPPLCLGQTEFLQIQQY